MALIEKGQTASQATSDECAVTKKARESTLVKFFASIPWTILLVCLVQILVFYFCSTEVKTDLTLQRSRSLEEHNVINHHGQYPTTILEVNPN